MMKQIKNNISVIRALEESIDRKNGFLYLHEPLRLKDFLEEYR